MKRIFIVGTAAAVLCLGVFIADVFAQQVWIVDILANPARYWNRQVTIIGDVQAVTPNPPGTTRGEYTILDDSGGALNVQTKDLPPVGKTYSVTGMVMQDPNNAQRAIIREISRSAPGMSSTFKLLLYAGGALFLILLIIFIVLLARPKSARVPEAPRATIRPTPPPPAPAPSPTVRMPEAAKTTKISSAPAAPAAAPDKTQVFMSLGAEIVIEKGSDKGKDFALHKQVTTIGRAGARKNDIELSDDTVSKEQASIFYDNTSKRFTVSNESMTNPTKVNGQVVTDPVLLKDGSLVEIGKTTLRFKVQ